MKIEIGDKVEVQFEHCNWFTGTVLYMPCATGDSWHIQDEDGKIHAVQTFAQIVQVGEK